MYIRLQIGLEHCSIDTAQQRNIQNFNMKTIIVLCVLVAVVASRPQETYDTRYDDFDANELVENTRLLTAYANCFLGKGPCTAEGTDFKKTIPDALKTKCSKCTPKQRKLIRVTMKGFQDKTPALWAELVKKEDPTGEYASALQEFLQATN